MTKIFLTGATGCVGSYVLSSLLADSDFQIQALVRTPEKIPVELRGHSRLKILKGDLADLNAFEKELKEAEYLIHTAVAWGESAAYALNFKQTRLLFESLNPLICRRIFYFSTASLLGAQQRFFPRCFFAGTDYIRSKAALHCYLQETTALPPLSVLYPTVILGGDSNHTFSAAGQGLKDLPEWMPWLRFLRIQGLFHWIHAADIAQMLVYWLKQGTAGTEMVLGNPAQTVGEVLAELSAYCDLAPVYQVPLEPFLPLLTALLSGQMNDWDRYSLRARNLEYSAFYPARLGLFSEHASLQQVLRTMGIAKMKKAP